MIRDALIDSKSVLLAIDQDEVDRVRGDPTWSYMQDEILNDPFEAFHFNVIEEITTDYIKLLTAPTWVAPKGFDFRAWPIIKVHYQC